MQRHGSEYYLHAYVKLLKLQESIRSHRTLISGSNMKSSVAITNIRGLGRERFWKINQEWQDL